MVLGFPHALARPRRALDVVRVRVRRIAARCGGADTGHAGRRAIRAQRTDTRYPRRCDARDAPPVAAADPREATRRTAHDVLAQHCGECHESHRPTAKPKALAIFDLDQPDWPSRFDEHKYNSALSGWRTSPKPRADAFIAFREAELAASSAKTN